MARPGRGCCAGVSRAKAGRGRGHAGHCARRQGRRRWSVRVTGRLLAARRYRADQRALKRWKCGGGGQFREGGERGSQAHLAAPDAPGAVVSELSVGIPTGVRSRSTQHSIRSRHAGQLVPGSLSVSKLLSHPGDSLGFTRYASLDECLRAGEGVVVECRAKYVLVFLKEPFRIRHVKVSLPSVPSKLDVTNVAMVPAPRRVTSRWSRRTLTSVSKTDTLHVASRRPAAEDSSAPRGRCGSVGTHGARGIGLRLFVCLGRSRSSAVAAKARGAPCRSSKDQCGTKAAEEFGQRSTKKLVHERPGARRRPPSVPVFSPYEWWAAGQIAPGASGRCAGRWLAGPFDWDGDPAERAG